jgi:hypothetical protein
MENVVAEQALEEHGAVNTEDQVNDHMEDDDHVDNIFEDDGTNTLIHDTFNVRMDHDDDHENDDFDDVHDLPLLEKAYKPLYEGSNITLLSVVLLIMNLKVMNGFSNTSITQMLRYVIYFIDHIYMIMIKVIFVPLKFLLLVHQ